MKPWVLWLLVTFHVWAYLTVVMMAPIIMIPFTIFALSLFTGKE